MNRSKIKTKNNFYEVIIIGGGPAGLNAAMILGRCRRKVLLFDSGKYRNQFASGIHGFLTRDNIPPGKFLKLCRQELVKYNVEIIGEEIDNGFCKDDYFEVVDRHGAIYRSQKLLLATGLRDNVPEIEGFADCYGKSIFHCPYCDGWEVRDKSIGIYSRTKAGYELALTLYHWSKDIMLFTDNTNYMTEKQMQVLKTHHITVYTEILEQVIHKEGQLKYMELKGGKKVKCNAVFFSNGFDQRSILGEKLGCKYTPKGVIENDRLQHTNVPGLFVAGDAAQDMQFVVVAAAEGAKAAVAINKELIDQRIKHLEKEEILMPPG